MTTTRDIAEPGPLMAGKRGLVMGVANDRSIAWGIARVLHGQGAELAFSYQGGAFGRRAVPLAQSIGAPIIEEADVEDLESVKRVFEVIKKKWGSLDFVVHALAFSDRNELKGRYADTTRANFEHTMVISCFSFTEISKLASELMPKGGSLLTLTYGGSTRVVPCYNVMGVAKAALEASVRYLASDFGPQGDQGECAVGGADAHARRCRHLGCAHPVPLPATSRADAPVPDIGRGWRRCALSAVGSVRRGDGRGAFRRLRLLDHRHAEPRYSQAFGEGREGARAARREAAARGRPIARKNC